MTRRGFALARQLAVFAVLAALALSLSGDRTSAAGVPAPIYGQDPLEVLELKVRPNVIVVLDSSGSMTATVSTSWTETHSGDHPRSKLWQAKQVLNSVVQNNQNKVSFQFLTYTQVGSSLRAQQAGRSRFQYSTTTMPATELTVQRALGDDAASNRGLQAWQIMYPEWGTLHFDEDADGAGAVDATCQATLTGLPKFYAQGGSGTAPSVSTTPQNLAYELQQAMDTAACPRTNTYSVSYNATTGVFTFARRTGGRRWRIAWDRGPNNIRGALVETSVSTTSWQTTGTRVTDYPYMLLYRTTGTGTASSLPTPFSYGLDVQWSFTETIGGTPTKYYQIAAARLWNGETIRVDSSGAVCGMDFATAPTNPPSLTVQAAGGAGCAATGDSATFTYSGGGFGGNNVSCRGGMSRVPLIPCDLAMPPAATQISNIGPYLEPELPFDGPAGVPRGYVEAQDGSWRASQAVTQPSAKANGWTPLGTSLMDIKGLPDGTDETTYQATGSGGCLVRDATTDEPCTDPTTQTCVVGGCVERNFSKLWNQGQAASAGPPQAYPLDPIKDHLDPKEKTIVLFVTDGDDTCPTRRNEDCRDIDPDGAGPLTPDGICDCIDVNGSGTCFDDDPDDDPDLGVVDLPASGPPDGDTDWTARRAAYYAERLYTPLVKGQQGSSVQTFMIGYGGAFSSGVPTRLNWIAWGGSGLGQGLPGQPDIPTSGTSCQSWGSGTLGDVSGTNTPTLDGAGQTGNCAWNATATQLSAQRARCTTCQDAFVAPDAATLASQLQAIIDQGASEGDFNAQQSITESVFEYVHRSPPACVAGVPTGPPCTAPDVGPVYFDAAKPDMRYGAIVPTLFTSTFKLPGFQGHVRAYQSDGAPPPATPATVEMWDAGEKLRQLVTFGDSNATTCTTGGTCSCNSTAVVGECVMSDLHGGATDFDIRTSAAKIKRRIYTTSRNGVYTFDPLKLIDEGKTWPPTAVTYPERVALWPPAPGVLPSGNDYSSLGLLDAAMGLPPNTPTAFPPNSPDKFCNPAKPDLPKKSFTQCWVDTLQRDYRACLGSNLPGACTSTTLATKMMASRREARDVIFAFLAGAAAIPDSGGLKRTPSTGPVKNAILYTARPWILADSELATAAVVTPPSLSEPLATPYVPEYKLFRDGTRNGSGKNVDSVGTQIRQGFGLTQPDDDRSVGQGEPDTRIAVKPVMTVVYAPANDMLHAFRAGPCSTPALATGCTESGGEELWGFVPYDQLEAVRLRPANEPQGRNNHVYMLARGIRFADVFVPGAVNRDIGGVPVSMNGVWRRILYFGRGIGGKHVTALDVTAPGPYTARALDTVPPIPLWNRGNPDTQNGLAGGPLNGSTADQGWYAKMGETWSMPTVAYVNQVPHFVIFMGSGYGNPGEGTTHYTLDALSGAVVAAADIGERPGMPYRNAIVANSVSFNRSSFESLAQKTFNTNPHPWSSVSARVYVGDLHGQLWKFLTEFPGTPILAADLGADQPVGTAVALMGEPTVAGDPLSIIPNIFVTSGADRRVEGPFKIFSLKDPGTDSDTATTGTRTYTNPVDGATVTTTLPVEPQFTWYFAQGEPEGECGEELPQAFFRGTVQPTSAVECDGQLQGSKCEGALLQRVFFGGTRLSLPNTMFAPPTPLACGSGQYPCRSQFDSILYALGVKTGEAAYDLNATPDDAYRIYRDSRIAAISFQADPNPGRGGSTFTADEGLIKGVPKPPPPPGIPPTTTSATASVILRREAGQPAPVVQYGSTVCQ